MSNPKMDELLERLVKHTEKDAVAWQTSSYAPLSYEFLGSEDDKVIIDSRDDDGQPPIDLLVYDADGNMVGDLSWSGDSADAETVTDNKLQKLWELARDRATGTSEVIDRLMRDLPD